MTERLIVPTFSRCGALVAVLFFLMQACDESSSDSASSSGGTANGGASHSGSSGGVATGGSAISGGSGGTVSPDAGRGGAAGGGRGGTGGVPGSAGDGGVPSGGGSVNASGASGDGGEPGGGGAAGGGAGDGGAGGAMGQGGDGGAGDGIPSIASIMAEYHSYQPQTPQPVSVSAYIFGLCRLPTLKEQTFADSEHGNGRYLQDWANEPAVSGIARRGQPAFDVGSIIVKEKYVPGTTSGSFRLAALGFMIKRESGFAPANGDWDFAYWEPELGVLSTAEQSSYCGGCHSGAQDTDFVFVDGLQP